MASFGIFWSNKLTKYPINTFNPPYFFITQFLLNLPILYLSFILNILQISRRFQFFESVEENLNYSIAQNFSSIAEVLNHDILSTLDLRYLSIAILLFKKIDPRDNNLENLKDAKYDEVEVEGDNHVPEMAANNPIDPSIGMTAHLVASVGQLRE